MDKCDIAIVILHYESLNDTKACLDSLRKYFPGHSLKVIVVDNGSQKGKIGFIEKDYSDNENIIFLYSTYNLGFANGNNIGFSYAKNNFNPKIIILANNDLIFRQDDFIDRLLTHYEADHFDIAGPRIISLKDGKNQNPVGLVYHTSKEIEKRIQKFEILNLLSYINCDLKVKKLFSKPIVEYKLDGNSDFQLHGACMFFGNRYLEKYNGLYNGTFMYGEEFILKYIADSNKLSMKYYDDIEVFHKEGSATETFWGKGKKQRQFFYHWSIDSLKQLKKMMDENVVPRF